MKKNIVILIIGIALQTLLMIYLSSILNSLTIITFMLFTILLPNIIIAISSLLFAIFTKVKRKVILSINVCYACISATISLIFCSIFVDNDLMNILIENTVVSDNMQVSITLATAGDNIQSYIIAVALAGISTLIADKIKNRYSGKKMPVTDLYDN